MTTGQSAAERDLSFVTLLRSRSMPISEADTLSPDLVQTLKGHAPMDTSSVFHIATLDRDHRKQYPEQTPWVFETECGQWLFVSEEQACAEQRLYREETGHDPITGARID